MTELIKILRTKDSFAYLKPALPKEINDAEVELGVRFADDYIEYVSEFGAASYYEHELTGVCKPKAMSVVYITKKEREINFNIADDLYVIERTGFDGLNIWQSGSGEIFQIQYKSIEKICNSLKEYICKY